MERVKVYSEKDSGIFFDIPLESYKEIFLRDKNTEKKLDLGCPLSWCMFYYIQNSRMFNPNKPTLWDRLWFCAGVDSIYSRLEYPERYYHIDS
jgi:hypothetical protein